MCGVVCGCRFAQEFGRVHHYMFWILSLNLFRHTRKHGGLDDRRFPLAYERDGLTHNGVAKAIGRSGRRHRDEYDVTIFYLVFIFPVWLFKRVAHDRKSATLKLRSEEHT